MGGTEKLNFKQVILYEVSKMLRKAWQKLICQI